MGEVNCGLTRTWISNGDKCYVVLMVAKNEGTAMKGEELNGGYICSPTDLFVPIALPIECEYSEEGIKGVVRDATVKGLEDVFNMKIENILESTGEELRVADAGRIVVHKMIIRKDAYDKVAEFQRDRDMKSYNKLFLASSLEQVVNDMTRSKEEVIAEAVQMGRLTEDDPEEMKEIEIGFYRIMQMARNTFVSNVFRMHNIFVRIYDMVDKEWFKEKIENFYCVERFMGYTGIPFMKCSVGAMYATYDQMEFLHKISKEECDRVLEKVNSEDEE